jgi:hypothetical protein
MATGEEREKEKVLEAGEPREREERQKHSGLVWPGSGVWFLGSDCS